MFNELDGMFALAIYSNRTKRLILARDRAGEKPLYIYSKNDTFAFSSELNSIARLFPLSIDHSALANYLRIGFFHQQTSPYKEVTELLPGHYMEVDCQTLSTTTSVWWDIKTFYAQNSLLDESQTLETFDKLIKDSVQRRIDSSDLEVGVFLSGGIDSGLVTAYAAQLKPGIRSFTVSFKGGSYDEAPLARLVADRYQTSHTEVLIDFDDLQDSIESIITRYGEPFMDSSAIPSYYVSRTAKEYLTVILNGDGADELFGGYRRYVPYARFDFDRLPGIVRHSLDITRRTLPHPADKQSRYNYLFRLIDFASKNGLDRYLSSTTDVFENYLDDFSAPASVDSISSLLADIGALPISSLQRVQLADFLLILPGDLLVKMDIATMANSLEGRSPFLSKELLELAPGLPDHFKIRGTTTKYLLRQLALRHLPAQLVNQPKRGFEVPLRKWVDGELKTIIYDYLSRPQLVQTFIKPDFIQKLLSQPRLFPAEKRAKMLYSLFAAEVWYRKVVQQHA